ncbi:hypothetical protein BAE44_0007784 [Dichanthelium oligosanthes]|uniref:Uncharacterized protein n=1 Tax=Dichanthelium oligosanthes TaxID=888268 RepID=A0A1E5W1D3_9POAL|nr:hypothetical protein BAE44_0007784 [Dichanthelium oligosanthes]
MAYAPQAGEPEVMIGPRARPHGPVLNHLQRRFLHAGRILVAGGWLVLTCAIGNRDVNPEHALVGLTLLLLGAFLIMLSPVANRFQGAARAGAAVADAVLCSTTRRCSAASTTASVLRAGCILVAGGWLVLTHTTIGNGSANAEHALAGFLLLLLGVLLIALPPVANRFPGPARVGAALADAVLLVVVVFRFQPGGN